MHSHPQLLHFAEVLKIINRTYLVVGEVEGRYLRVSVETLDLRKSVLREVQLLNQCQGVQVLNLGQAVTLKAERHSFIFLPTNLSI